MSRDHRTPFAVTGGECKAIIDQVGADNRAAWGAMNAFVEKYGCTRYRACGGIRSLVCEGEIPDGWMHRKGDPLDEIVPKKKAIRDEMRALPKLVDPAEFARRLGCPWATEGTRIYWPYTETVGELSLSLEGHLILWVPNAALKEGYRPPSGAEEMKMSDYWLLKERAGEAE